jgi:hypothetical protein
MSKYFDTAGSLLHRSGAVKPARSRPFPGIGAPLAALTVVVGMLLLAPGALAAGAPVFIHRDIVLEASSTRVATERNEALGLGELETEWKAEYSESSGGPWIEVNKETRIGTPSEDSAAIFIGAQDRVLRHLAADTQYYARFWAKNADGEAEYVIPFKTLPVGKPEVDNEFLGTSFHTEGPPTDTTAVFDAQIEGNGASTEYSFEYAPSAGGPWTHFTSGATGTISVAEEYAAVSADLTGLIPETTYYVRLKMNGQGETIQSSSVTTLTAKPQVEEPAARNITTGSARVADALSPHGYKTSWRFEYAESVIGPWNTVPGGKGEGTISQAQAEATPYASSVRVGATLTGLSPARGYYVRLFAENAAGEGEFCHGNHALLEEICEPVSGQTQGFGVFETSAPPSAMTFAVHGLVGGSLQLDGGVDPKNTPTSAEQTITLEGAPTGGTFTLTFDGHETAAIAYDAPADEGEGAGSVQEALHAAGVEYIHVVGAVGGPYTTFYEGAGGGVSEPQIEANGSGLTPSGKVSVHTDFKGGEAAETHYRFRYVSEASFAEDGWSGAQETPEVLASPGNQLEVVNALLPALTAGETYRYRVLASSSAPGIGVVEGSEQTLTVPKLVVEPSPAGCPNEAFRTGLSAHLPDCRAYEQLSPVEKGGSQEPFKYSIGIGANVLVSEDGERVVLEAEGVNYGVGPGAGGSPYFFAREAPHGWGLTGGSPQPQTGVNNLHPEVYSADLTQIALSSEYTTSASAHSENVDYDVGPAGGPYTTVAVVPYDDTAPGGGWVAANGGFSKLVFQTLDHNLLGESTGTRSGSDLYEYTASGGLRQLNVMGSEPGVTIGSCGATIVDGPDEEGMNFPQTGRIGGAHSVSADGSRVFFKAVPSKNCSEPTSLYMRVNGTETVDIGVYKFMGANAQGTGLLLQDGSGALLAYDTETHALTQQSSGEVASAQELALLGIPARIEAGEGAEPFAHPRYTYWGAVPHKEEAGKEGEQAYRYDSVEHLVECISCASAFDQNPQQPAFMSSVHGKLVNGGVQDNATASANGEFAFFTTPSALVPQDVDGEFSVEGTGEYWDIGGGTTSPSSDIYEWRAAGVDGCAQLQGCLALITDGRGGYMNLLWGTADEGRDVFIYTRSTLVAQTGRPEGGLGEGNIYDARVDGGFAPAPPRPTECEGDACSTPPGAPSDATPSSLTFSGQGNVPPAPSTKTVVKSKKPKKKAKKKLRKKGRARSKGRVRKASRGVRA